MADFLDAYKAGSARPSPESAGPPAPLAPSQRRTLERLCRIRREDGGRRWLGGRVARYVLLIAINLGVVALVREWTASAPAAYLLLGFVLGGLLTTFRQFAAFRGVWPLYERIIDWPAAERVLAADTLATDDLATRE